MKRDMAKKLWLFAAACFIFLGIADKNTTFIVLGAAYIGIGFSMNSKKSADAAKKTSKKGTFHKLMWTQCQGHSKKRLYAALNKTCSL